MEILGVGGFELVAILIITMLVAGPKRMLQWAYLFGQFVAKLKRMWAEVAATLQKEFDESGVDVKVPTQIPTRQTLTRELNKALKPISQPLQETTKAINTEINGIKSTVKIDMVKTPEAAAPSTTDFGAWSQPTAQQE